MLILEDLYLGNVRPSERSFKRNSQYAKALDEAVMTGDALTDTLTEKQKEMFEEYMTAQREVNVLTDCETFCFAFRLGAKIMIAGWPPHQSIDESLSVIRNVLNGKEAYAICLKEDGKAIGAIELKLNGHTDMTDRDEECELGYWLGKPYWGQGIMTEAVKEMLRHAFEDCGMQKVWAGYYEGNDKSKRVQEKCGFRYQWKSENVDVPLMHEKRTGHVSVMTREDWLLGR